MRKYVKRPVEVEAVQWTGDNRPEIWDFCSLCYFNTNMESGELKLMIQTLEGVMEASKGDYIIKGVQGEFYPVKEDIFKLTYDEVNK
jgi:hypothetical protein